MFWGEKWGVEINLGGKKIRFGVGRYNKRRGNVVKKKVFKKKLLWERKFFYLLGRGGE